jgi:DNA (cytosine-5)-methyltransferase 1
MKSTKITLLDLFSGIGGFHKGLEQAGFEVESYFSEIDKYAIQVYQNNFKKSKYVGSVTDVHGRNLPKIDAITFGSPCQDFSIAGKRKGMEGDRSSLISEAIRLISECRPKFFVWENVKGTFSSNNGEDFWAIIQAFANIGGYRLEWQLLNTKWFLPQNRERIYLVGYLGNGSGGQVFPIGENKRKVDVIQRQQANTNCITARYDGNRNDEGLRIRKDKNSPCLATRKHSDKDVSTMPPLIIKCNTKKGFEIAEEGDTINYSVPNSKTRRGRVGKGIAQTLDTACNQAVIKSKIRRLTPIECERLQGFPDNWTKEGTEGLISDSQRYKMCGNAVTVDVVQAVTERIKYVVYG